MVKKLRLKNYSMYSVYSGPELHESTIKVFSYKNKLYTLYFDKNGSYENEYSLNLIKIKDEFRERALLVDDRHINGLEKEILDALKNKSDNVSIKLGLKVDASPLKHN